VALITYAPYHAGVDIGKRGSIVGQENPQSTMFDRRMFEKVKTTFTSKMSRSSNVSFHFVYCYFEYLNSKFCSQTST